MKYLLYELGLTLTAMSSAKERQAKRRAKIREDPELYKAHLKKDRKRKLLELRNKKAKMTNDEREEFLLKERIRLRKLRAEKKPARDVGECSISTPYRSSQSLGKAMKRVRTSLPKSPRKQRCVVSKLAESIGLNVSPNSSPSTLCHGSALSTDTKKCVVEFYNNCDISWQAPGCKDWVIIRETIEGERVKRTEQVRFMLMSLREAYSNFKEEYPSLKVGLTKFCEWCPAHMKLFDQIPHQVCVCSYHENVRLLLVALKEHTTLNTDFSAFTEQVTCDPSAKVCMSGKCSKCANAINKYDPVNRSHPVRYQQWQSVDNRVEKVDKMGTVGDCFDELKTQVGPFLLHTYVKRKQAASFKSLVEGCDGKSVVLQVDFSENATIASQREVQSAHWNHGQATLFTAHAWIKAGSGDTEPAEGRSMVIVSDELNHTKYSIYVFMQHFFAT